jgi:two-component system CheB/CheR fusion protein
MQSLNEELQTVNAELHSKVDLLSQANDDMVNLLNSTDIATIFLDDELRILRFTKRARRVVKLIDQDIGRHLGDIATMIESEDLEAAAKDVLDTLKAYEKEVQAASGDWYLMRLVPYRTSRNVIEGLVMTFVDIDDVMARREAEVKYEGAMAFANGLTETLREPLLVLNGDLRVMNASRAFYDKFDVSPEETNGQYVYELGNGQWDIPSLRQLLEDVLPDSNEMRDYEVTHEFPRIGRRRMMLDARCVTRPEGSDDLILLAIEDVTDGAEAAADPGEGREGDSA